MIHSMTGFASKTFSIESHNGDKAIITLHLKTLNSRFFEVQTKMTHIFSHLETKINGLLKKHLKRGFITVTLYTDNKNFFKGAVHADMATTQSYKDAIDAIQEKFALAGSLTLHDIILLPNVFSSNDLPLNESIEQQILNEVADTIAIAVESRAQEGAILAKDLQERFAIMDQEMTAIEKRATILLGEHKEKIAALTTQTSVETDPQSEARKTALYLTLDKMDVHEEIVRFKNHLKNIVEYLHTPDVEKGKRLDFTLQELGREINTISAKCADSTLATHAINIKVEIEKAREQAQNIV